jgi:hypothetical protein
MRRQPRVPARTAANTDVWVHETQLENSATGGQAGGIPGAPEARRERTERNRRLEKQVAVPTALGERGSTIAAVGQRAGAALHDDH